MSRTYLAGIAGFRGYSGAELLRILERHPSIEPVLLEHRAGSPAEPEPLNHASRWVAIRCTPEEVRAEGLSAVLLATPHEVSLELAPRLLAAGVRVIDLSGAFRLSASGFERWYKMPHPQPELLPEAVYGLPELRRKQIAGARFISNPGCYPTAANLAIQPLIEAGVVNRAAGLVCDAKSGVSGAGRAVSARTSFCEVAESFSAYAVLEHRHVPEILMVSELDEDELSFTAQLLPINRGILETVYFRSGVLHSERDLLAIYAARYAGEPFVYVSPSGSLPDLRAVNYTNRCAIGAVFDARTGRGVVVSAIDNLGKGAAGQAVQNLNLSLGLDETAGLV